MAIGTTGLAWAAYQWVLGQAPGLLAGVVMVGMGLGAGGWAHRTRQRQQRMKVEELRDSALW